MKKYKHYLSVISIGLASVAFACKVPVFRYALERWPADNYELVILHDGPLSDLQMKPIQGLLDSDYRSPASANFSVRLIEASGVKDKALKAAWTKHGDAGQPVLAALYPKSMQEIPDRLFATSLLKPDSAEHLADSPLRRTIARRLSSGESAVWIFVPCGDRAQDEIAFNILTHEVKANEESLELPEQEEITEEQELLEQVDIELRLDFSVVTLDRDDPEEQFFLKMLLATEPDLAELNQPMAFPVLGRGRVLYALVGKGISEPTIGLASRFIIGPCSCQVKSQNPGVDLLMTCDWDEKIGKAKLSDPLPESNTEPMLLTIPPGR